MMFINFLINNLNNLLKKIYQLIKIKLYKMKLLNKSQILNQKYKKLSKSSLNL
jgi:ribosomal protein S3AE